MSSKTSKASKAVGEGNKAFTVILPIKTYEELARWAETKDWKLSQAARNLIEDGLDRIAVGDEPIPRKLKP